MLKGISHRRFNPLLNEWVLVSPDRLTRPWQGRTEPTAFDPAASYDAHCYLCPGNARAGGAHNPDYTDTFVFDNDFPALRADAGQAKPSHDRLLIATPEPGICRVVCFTPRHDLSIARMPLLALARVVDVWAEQFTALGALPWINHVEIFENRGASMGASNPHPHGQIWATSSVPPIPLREQAALVQQQERAGDCLLCEYARLEMRQQERVVCANAHFVVVVPFWAVWPYETMLVPMRHVAAIDALTPEERAALAEILKDTVTRYDALFAAPCAYSMGFHQRPTDGRDHHEWHLHAHFFPPALRSATVHKFLVGFELLAMPQRDLTPEDAAARLRDLAVL